MKWLKCQEFRGFKIENENNRVTWLSLGLPLHFFVLILSLISSFNGRKSFRFPFSGLVDATLAVQELRIMLLLLEPLKTLLLLLLLLMRTLLLFTLSYFESCIESSDTFDWFLLDLEVTELEVCFEELLLFKSNFSNSLFTPITLIPGLGFEP